MKKLFYILAMLVALTACNKEIGLNGNTFAPEDGMVKVSFTAIFPDAGNGISTKAMADIPEIDSMYVAVFGSEGKLQHWTPAKLEGRISAMGIDPNNHNCYASYSVYLPITDKKRSLHFIANPPKANPVFDDEDVVINAMVVEGTHDSYWQKIELPNGIGGVEEGGVLVPDEATKAAIDTVCLVRNYAKIQVFAKEGEDFQVLRYALINYPTKGSVAPWNTGSKMYEPKYMNIMSYARSFDPNNPESAVRFYDDLSASYGGYMPDVEAINTDLPPTSALVNSGVGVYMYERTKVGYNTTVGTQTAILAEIQWKAGHEFHPAGEDGIYWYKIEILDPAGEYIPILRNILYTLELSGLTEKGYASMEAAYNGDFFGNISSNLSMASLNELSDGASTIRVNHTEYTSNGLVVGSAVPDYTIYWQFFPNSSPAAGGTPVTTFETTDTYQTSVSSYDLTNDSAINGNLSYGQETYEGATWGAITVPIAQKGNDVKTSVVRVTGRAGNTRAIYREVVINVLPSQDFVSTSATARSIQGTDQPVVISFKLPDGLGSSLFPLNIYIEAKEQTLSSTSPDLPVSSGKSYFYPTLNAFYFIKQISYNDYRKIVDGQFVYNTEYTCTLYTTKTGNNNGTDGTIHLVLHDEKGFLNPEELNVTVNP